MSNHSSTKFFGKFQCKQRPADVMTFFFGLHLILDRKMDICGHDDPQRTCLQKHHRLRCCPIFGTKKAVHSHVKNGWLLLIRRWFALKFFIGEWCWFPGRWHPLTTPALATTHQQKYLQLVDSILIYLQTPSISSKIQFLFFSLQLKFFKTL